MDLALLGGCAAGGVLTGAVLDRVAAAVPAAPAAPAAHSAIPAAHPGIPAAPAATDQEGLRFERTGAAVVTGVLFVLAAARLGAVPELAAYCVLFAGLVALSTVDIRVGLVPRKILYPTLVVMSAALVAAAVAGGRWSPLVDGAVGGVAAFLVFYAIWWLFPKGMGMGDVRLAGLIGTGLGYLGFRQLYLGFLIAFVVGSVIGVVKMAVQGTGRKTALPFGPALAAGAVVGVLWGGALAGLWLHGGV